MQTKTPKICIIGAGVVGLSCATKILEEIKDAHITIVAESFIQNTTSCGSAGLWEPYQIHGTSDDQINKWGKYSFDHFLKLFYSCHAAEAGVQLLKAYKLLTLEDTLHPEEHSWKDVVLNFKAMSNQDLKQMMLPEKFTAGFSFETLVIDQKYYLTYLTKHLLNQGVILEQMKLKNIQELFTFPPPTTSSTNTSPTSTSSSSFSSRFDAVINCTGLGSATLFHDTDMIPIRGQVLRIQAPWMKNIWFWGKSYIIPNIDNIVCGGTADRGNWDVTPSLYDTNRILNDICELFPAIRNATIDNVWVGLRPGRTTALRLEMEMHRIVCAVVAIDDGTNSNDDNNNSSCGDYDTLPVVSHSPISSNGSNNNSNNNVINNNSNNSSSNFNNDNNFDSIVSTDYESLPTASSSSSSSSSSSIELSIPVFHCYGHGGSGVTLAMGCAHDLVTNLLLPALGLTATTAGTSASHSTVTGSSSASHSTATGSTSASHSTATGSTSASRSTATGSTSASRSTATGSTSAIHSTATTANSTVVDLLTDLSIYD